MEKSFGKARVLNRLKSRDETADKPLTGLIYFRTGKFSVSVVSIGSNISSLKAQRRLSEGTTDLSKTFERLSSGMRINRASDDAAGLSISESLKTDRRVFNQAVRNLNDGVSLLAIADSAVENLSGIVIRLKELAEQSANGTFGLSQRKSLDAEAQALSQEYFRISRSVEFNGLSLFTGNLGELRLQAGYGTDGSILSGLGGAIGTGTFHGPVTYQAESSRSHSNALGDLNGDGILDLVTAGESGGTGRLIVRLGLGDGTFGAATSYAMESTASRSVTLGDLNGDGILDVVTAGSASGGRATVRLGAGNGTFGTAVSYLMESTNSYSVSLADLNGDGIPDMVTAGTGGGAGRTTVRLGAGDGTFGAALSYLMHTTSSSSVFLGDLNGDGIPDMVSAGFAAGAGTTVRLGVGDGTFGAAVSYETHGIVNNSVVLGDINGDGALDMISVAYAGEGVASIRLGRGDGTFGERRTYSLDVANSFSISLGDVNGDGIMDLVSAGSDAILRGSASIRLGNGDGTFGASLSYLTGTTRGAVDVALGDVNGDGVLDIVTAGYQNGATAGISSVFTANSRSGVSPLLPFDLTTRAGALQALPVFTQKLDQLARQRGTIGAFQSRIEVAVNTLQVASENSAAAASRITDVDVADESSKLTRLNILQQAASSVLAQANLQPQIALTLLR